ncbi:MAG: superoxide dismutase family protein [Pseudomonadota bacterium]
MIRLFAIPIALCTLPMAFNAVALAQDQSQAHAAMAGAQNEKKHSHAQKHVVDLPENRRDASADLIGATGERIGEVVISDGPHGMVIRVEAQGIEKGFHGVHFHQVGTCADAADGFKAAGPHIGVSGAEHGLLNPDGYHTGALFPNIYAAAEGHLHTELFGSGLTLEDIEDEDGFTLIVHVNEDDHVTQPLGGAGARIACAAFR